MNKRLKRYTDLLLKCVKLNTKKYIYIELPSFLSELKESLLESLKEYDLEEYHIEEKDPYKKHYLMKELDQESINKHPLFDNSIKNKYASIDAAFLFISSSIPGLMEDIDPEKIKNTTIHLRSTEKEFRELYENDKLNWCIAGASNEMWAKSLNMSENQLWDKLFDICMIDKEGDPYTNWINKLNKLNESVKVLNNYNFEYLTYTNSIGTNLKVYLPINHIWECCGKDGLIVNLPSEEIFTSPQYNKTEGIVYSTKPLIYNNVLIEDFWIKFENGKVIDFDSKLGKEVLTGIIKNDPYSCYLGECALVSYDSRINNTNIIFKDTLYDENASCHLALGSGFNECVLNGEDKSEEDLRRLGINAAKIHVDFMIGSKDMKIVGTTFDKKNITIMENGNLII